jgi:broad specificity phosphatase PhoE
MREVYLVRHAEKGADDEITKEGREAAALMKTEMPDFKRVVASDSPRAQLTAKLLTGRDPEVDERAGYGKAKTSPELSQKLNKLAKEEGTTFLQQALIVKDPEMMKGIDAQARELIDLMADLLVDLGPGEKALLVSHDLTISPAMEIEGIPMEPIGPLHGYIVSDGEPKIRKF